MPSRLEGKKNWEDKSKTEIYRREKKMFIYVQFVVFLCIKVVKGLTNLWSSKHVQAWVTFSYSSFLAFYLDTILNM